MSPPQPALETGEAAATESPDMNHLVPPAEPYPWFLYCHGQNQTFIAATPKSSSSSPSSGFKIYERSIPELRNKKVMVCCHGWLLVSDEATLHNYSLWNPSTSQSIVLPPLNLDRDFRVGWCVLSSPPDTINSFILLVEQCKPNIIFLRIGRGHQQWIERQCSREQLLCLVDDQDGEWIHYPVCCNGQVYVTTCKSANLMKVDIVDDDEEEDMNKFVLTPLVPLPSTRINASGLTKFYVESSGQLFIIYLLYGWLGQRIIDVEVYKLDLGEKRWEQVRSSIQDQVFFLGHQNSFSCSAQSQLDRGRMYFSSVSCYNIDEKSLSDDENLPRPASTPIWVMPNCRRRIGDNHTNGNGSNEVEREEVPEEEVVVKKTSDYEEDSKQTTLLDLPHCILGEISRHLAFLDYMNLRAVCRVLSKAAPVSEWRKSSEDHCLYPWLMLCGETINDYTFIDTKFGGRYFMRVPQELVDATVHCAKDGWLLMSIDDDSMFFFNPFTKAILPCPPLSLGCHAISYLMSSAPTNSNYFVAAIDLEEDGVGVYYIHNGDEKWEYQKLATGSNFKPNHNSPAPWLDEFYFLGCEGNLLCLEFMGDDCDCEVVPEPQPPCDSFDQNFLVECDENMYSIFVGKHEKWVQVFAYVVSDDKSTMIWRRVYSIGNWTMFLSRFSCLSVEAEHEKMGDRIYFPRLHKGSLVFYSLKTGKFHSNNGEETVIDYAGTTELLLCCWTDSRWS